MTYLTLPVKDEAAWKAFLDLPFKVYAGDTAWVPPLRSQVRQVLSARNPYFRDVPMALFVCYADGNPVARAMALANPRHKAKFGEATAFFGFFESIRDPQATASLFDALEDFSRQHGATSLEGPFNPNHYSELGLLTENFSSPAFFETYNPPWYAELLEGAGFKPILRLHTRIILEPASLARADHLADVPRQAREAGYTIRPVNLLHLRADMDKIREVYNDAFADNWHFLPATREEYDFLTPSMFLVTNPSLVQIVEYQGEPVGVLQLVLNLNPALQQMKGHMSAGGLLKFVRARLFPDELVLYATGIRPTHRHRLAIDLLEWKFRQLGKRYRTIYGTWMSETNTAAIKAGERVGFIPYKWFHIYAKPIKP